MFAPEITNKIEASRTAGLFHRLILVVPLAFYGLLNKSLSEPLEWYDCLCY
nr:hypothetical protein [Coxiella-like endosymbiont of Rhipicephalus sanguineus]